MWPCPGAHGREVLSTTRNAGIQTVLSPRRREGRRWTVTGHKGPSVLPCLCHSPGEAVLVLPPAGGQSPELRTCPGPLHLPRKQGLAGTTGSAESFPEGKVFPSRLGFFSLPAAPGLAFINEYCSSEHLGNIPDCRTALGRAMEQQNPKEGNRNSEYWILLCTRGKPPHGPCPAPAPGG